MDQWKYGTVGCYLKELKDVKGKRFFDWVVTFTDDTQIVGIDEILDHWGNNGWELVNAVAERFSATGESVVEYRLFFKRRA